MSGVTLRPATPADLPRVWELVNELDTHRAVSHAKLAGVHDWSERRMGRGPWPR